MLDQQLVERCLTKDPGAWETFVGRYARLLFWAIKRALHRAQFLHTQQDLEDLFQQVLLLLWETKLKEARGIRRLCPWLVVVTHRFVLDYVKAQRRVKRRALAQEVDVEQLLSPALDPGRTLETRELGMILEGLLNSLSPQKRAVIRLNLLEEKTYSEIAQLLKLPIGTISSLIKRVKEEWVGVLRKKGISP